ncbi:hypothetical protein Lbir_1080 [Legionella birminghamensis]|uniref:Uncharacterized protein n=1 Tax=Legionella birminghamensis TaxID=28083 RepID=A0A378IEL4_9GAMM|nr:hypothetical protein [Legionella birminghamensis]KTC73818.1 hypothetical protein Lbir_1080 [Legionella birminghamensis]STX30684.1 Uncharacterised protein [Legionella birminghamensis]
MEKHIIFAFKKAVSTGDLDQCLTLLKDYSAFEKDLCASLTTDEILELKRLAILSVEEDETNNLLLPILERSYIELKPRTAPLHFIQCYNLIDNLRQKHGFAGCGDVDAKIKEGLWFGNPHVPDFDMGSAIFKGSEGLNKNLGKKEPQLLDIHDFPTHWSSKAVFFQENNKREQPVNSLETTKDNTP